MPNSRKSITTIMSIKNGGLLLALIGFNGLAWLGAWLAFRDYPLLMGTAMLAYSFGLRHAVDADHIAAIDNVTRKLMQDGQRPASVGLYFSLGHSTVVVGLSLALAAGASFLQARFGDFRAIGGVVGTAISAFFLLAIAAVNLAILYGIWKTFRALRRGEAVEEQDLDLLLSGGGLLSRIFRRLFRMIGSAWHMYPLGLLFGLGFDTATEVGLLGISAASGSQGLPIWSIMLFPALFTAGMALVDTADGMLMLGAYGWAFRKPIRKLYYNLTITLVSVGAALLVGGAETVGLIGNVDIDLGALGYGMIGFFALSWLLSFAIYRAKGFDKVTA